jgi:eukaryotic-like serine/threonine-protein kinase
MLRSAPGARAGSRFELITPLGRGGFGSVYEAWDSESGQRVALKELGQPSGDNLARFKQEFRALAGLHHPNLVGLKELFEQDGRWFIVMDLIDGDDFVRHVRSGPENDNAAGYDEGRLRTALAGLVQGLSALHEFGILHRDLKPTNTCVTLDGRAVLLDFGLITSVDPTRQSTDGIALGTAAYMAPEQAHGRNIGAAADWYALGVCLFEALTDRLPFEGSSGLALILQKQQARAPRVAELVPDVAPDLDALCARLLEPHPGDRPSGREILGALGLATPARVQVHSLAPGDALVGKDSIPTFAGRETEIENLERALLRTNQGELRLVLVEGESGVGKSQLVAEFLRSARLQHVSLVALHGRCYENEQVPYKAFDGCVDELAKLLRKLPSDECQSLMPSGAALLGQLFPVLSHVPSIARARRDQLPADPSARRLAAFAAFSGLLAKLAEDRPVVLVIDDLQWADAESFRMLKALVESRERPPVLVLATIRPREELEPEILEHVERARAWKCTDMQPLFGLPRAQAEALAQRLLGDNAAPSWVRAIAEESRGHPLLLSELVHFARSREIGSSSSIALDDALKARIEPLDKGARELLELVALAARPYGRQVFAHALARSDVEDIANPLLMSKLLRKRKGHELGCFHDRIRHAVVRLILRTRLPYLHRRLAEALAREAHVDASEQARHWDLAGEREGAVTAYEKAAQAALEALAFVRAAQLSSRALELLESPRDDRYPQLLVMRAHALSCGGRSGEAAAVYARAAELASGEQRIRLQSSAANHLMLSGQVGAGLLAARQVLAELGVNLPLSTRGALLRFAWERLCHALLRRGSVATAQAEAKARLAVEVISALNRSIAILHLPAYLALSVQHLRLAASLADPAQLVQSYAIQGWLRTVRGSLGAGLALFDQSRKLCAELGRPALSAWQALSEGNARLTDWDVAGSEACLSRAQQLLQTHCPDQPRELTTARLSLGHAWYLLGRHGQLAQETEGWLAEARERQDHLGVALLTGAGCGFLRHLMEDAPERALAELDEAMARVPAEPFSFAHYGHLAAVQVSLAYQGGSLALRWLDARRAYHRRCFLLRSRYGKEGMVTHELVATLRASEGMAEAERTRAFRAASVLAGRLGSRPSSMMRALSLLHRAQLAAVQGRRDQARQLARQARGSVQGPNWFGLFALSYLDGLLEDSDAGRKKCETTLAALREQGWQNPERALTILLPLLPQLTRSPARQVKAQRLLIERYEVLQPLGSGGYSNVVEGRDRFTGRRVALKELSGTRAKPLERFKREFRALQHLYHENLVRLDALFEHQGGWFIAMELVEGTDLLSYVRPGGKLDPARVRGTFLGLAQGLSALHESGFVHRDVTPANVLVTSGGRAVLCDFGLIAESGDEGDTHALGTPAYAAPEQLEGTVAHSSADVYALGACLYQALTGKPPQGPHPARGRAARKPARPASSEALPEVELSLCLRMLDPEPRARPALSEVMASLSPLTRVSTRPRRDSLSPPGEGDGERAFSGRSVELSRLTAAFERARTDGLTLALVRGESGLGKSRLIDEFVRQLQAARPNVLVLSSRCYENELLALKAFDGAIDVLARKLARLPASECGALLPKKAALLAQLFPVLAGVPAIASAGKKGLPADPAARQLAAFECFVQLVERLSTRFALVFTVDDLQWADGESFRLLRALLEHRTTLPVLIVCTSRGDDELEGPAAEGVAGLCSARGSEDIRLAGLADHEASQFAVRLLGDEALPQFVDQLVQESRGHPLFLRELVARARAGHVSKGAPSLDDALCARIHDLDTDARALLTVVALAGRPCRQQVLAAALACAELPRAALAQLLAQGLLRKRADDELVCYHDSIRRAALQLLDDERRRGLSARLAQALEREASADAAERARLWDLAEDRARALAAYEQAGDHALQKLAFAQAERHYARALELLAEREGEVFRRICMQRGHALVRMGQSAEAASVFQQAAQVAEGEQQIRLRIWAAQHQIQSAQVEEGLRSADAVLSELGLPLAATDKAALRRIAWERARIALRGTALKRRRHLITASERLVLDALKELSAPVRAVSYLPGSTLVVQYLRRALDAGEADHSARALAYEGLWRSVANPAVSQAALHERARQLADQTGEALVVAEVELTRGVACVVQSDYALATRHLSNAHELLQTSCPGQSWLVTAVRAHLGQAWLYGGQLRQLVERTGPWLSEARAKRDRYASAAIATFGSASFRHLLRDEPDAALAELDEVMAPWPAEPITVNHIGDLTARACAYLQRGGGLLLTWLDANHARFYRSYLLETPAWQVGLAARRALACLSAIPSSASATQHPLFAEAEAQARRLRGLRTALAPGMAQLVSAGLCAIAGGDTEAVAHARAAQVGLAKLATYGLGARYLEGLVTGGAEGRAQCEVILAELRAQGVVNPQRFLRSYVPGLALLESRL